MKGLKYFAIIASCLSLLLSPLFSYANEGAVTQNHPRNTVTKKASQKPKKPKSKWSGNFSSGFEYNTNATSESIKRPVPSDERGFKYPISFGINYALVKKGPWELKASYSQSASLYEEILDNLNTSSYSPSFTLIHKAELAEKKFLTTQLKSGFTYTIVDHKYYNKVFTESLTLTYPFTDYYKLTFSEKLNFELYKSEGTKEDVSSKQGLGNTTTFTNYFYMNKKKTKYIELGFVYDRDNPEGANFVKNEYDVNTAFNFPVRRDWTGAVGFKFKYADYPETTASIQRIDKKFIPSTSLTIPLVDKWKLKIEYEYTNDDSNDPAFKHLNHASGMVLSKSF